MRSRKTVDRTKKREQVRRTAKESVTTGQASLFVSGSDVVPGWGPPKAATFRLDVLPYVIKTEGHPDHVGVGEEWWKLSFDIHMNIGIDGIRVVCPRSLGIGPCPICEEYRRLSKDWAANEAACKAIKAKHWTAMNIVDPDESSGVCIFCMSNYNFLVQLVQELEDEQHNKDDENSLFFDLGEDGRTLLVRFKDATFSTPDGASAKFLQADRIDFKPRKAKDDETIDKWLAKVWDLQSVLVVHSYDELKAMYEGQIAADASDWSEGADRPDEDDGGDDDAPSTFRSDDDDSPDSDSPF